MTEGRYGPRGEWEGALGQDACAGTNTSAASTANTASTTTVRAAAARTESKCTSGHARDCKFVTGSSNAKPSQTLLLVIGVFPWRS